MHHLATLLGLSWYFSSWYQSDIRYFSCKLAIFWIHAQCQKTMPKENKKIIASLIMTWFLVGIRSRHPFAHCLVNYSKLLAGVYKSQTRNTQCQLQKFYIMQWLKISQISLFLFVFTWCINIECIVFCCLLDEENIFLNRLIWQLMSTQFVLQWNLLKDAAK